MPLYTYECKKCHELIEDYYQLITEKDLTRCPACGGTLVKIMSKCSFILHGSGWAKDGYSMHPVVSERHIEVDKQQTGKSDKLPPQTNK